ncbi:MAG: NPCBM/NEW2 domain-containing protein [Planctomycetota bacterium]|nr:NPCBM/NEW2 domain-containing protein [Planctomycetota bacterium]
MKRLPDTASRWTGVVLAVAGCAGVLIPAALAATAPDPPQVYAKKATWAESMAATRARYVEWLARTGKAESPSGFQPFDSGAMPGDGPAQHVSLNVSGLNEIRLVTVCEQGTANCSIWGEPRLIAKDGSETRLGALKPASVVVGWGQLLVDKNWQGNPLQIGDRKFLHGLWVHAASELVYPLAGKYERFEAWVGEDKDRANGKVRFRVLSGQAEAPPAFWQKMTADFPLQTGWLTQDFDSNNNPLIEWSRKRETAAQEQSLVERVLGQAGLGSESLRKELATLSQASAPAGDARWLDLYARAWRFRECAVAIRQVGPESRPALEKELADLAAARPATEDPRWADLRGRAARYAELEVQFEALKHDLANRAHFAKIGREAYRPDIKRHRSLFNHMCDQYYGMAQRPGGGLYVLADPFGPSPQVRDVLAGSVVQNGRLKGQKLSGGPLRHWNISFDGEGNQNGEETIGGSFLSPDLSYDGQTILFAYVECTGDRRHRRHTDPTQGHWAEGRCYHVFRVNVDGTGLAQLTDGTWNDFDPCWLPNGRIAFMTERRGGYLRCGRTCPTYTLYDMDARGGDVNCLSFHETNEWNPSVTNDGRIIYTRWDYVDRFGCTAHHPWITTLDGTDSRAVHGNFAPRNARPDMELDIRSIPGSGKYVATAAPHHSQCFGSLVMIDPDVKDDDAMRPLRRLSPDVGFPESQGGTETYGMAWPLSEDYYLCVYDARMELRKGGGNYGIYLVDAFGNKELIYRDPEIACMSPIPLRPRPAPATGAAPAYLTKNKAPRAAAYPGKEGEATIALVNVYDSLKPWPEGTRIKALRVLQVLPMSVPSGGPPHETGVRVALAGDSVVPVRHVLGTVPVEEDGSAHFVVPANREMFFQALDSKGLAVQSMRSATYLHEGERLVCAGCHEPRHNTPTRTQVPPLAMRREPSRLAPDVEGANPFSYARLVQPVLDRACVECHAKPESKAPSLAREPIQRKWYASYNTLVKYGFTNYGDNLRTTPGKFGAKGSKLYEILTKGHYDVKLSEEDLHRITLWLDCCSMFYGVYEKEGGEAQLRGEIARPTLE